MAQVLGGIVGAGIVYATYSHAIDIFEGGRGVRTLETAGLFGTLAVSATILHRDDISLRILIPQASYLTNVSSFFSEFVGAAILTMTVFAMSDKKNLAPPSGLAPLVLAFVLGGLATSLGGTGNFPIRNYFCQDTEWL